MRPDGETTRAKPENFGVIGNGHHIKFGDPRTTSPWDESFEYAFQSADNNFPKVIDWLERLPCGSAPCDQPIAARFCTHKTTDEQFSQLIECVVSLAVRSPMHRNAAVRTAEHLRGTIEPRERNAIVGLNIRHSLQNALKQIGGRGKALVVFSPNREFVFGDGFFNNLTPPADHILNPRLFVPLTPRMAVLFTRPSSYLVEPRIVSLVVSDSESEILNRSIQIYSKEEIFYRSERPIITDNFSQGQHLEYADHDNPIDQLIHTIPGVPARDPWLDALLREGRRRSIGRPHSA